MLPHFRGSFIHNAIKLGTQDSVTFKPYFIFSYISIVVAGAITLIIGVLVYFVIIITLGNFEGKIYK